MHLLGGRGIDSRRMALRARLRRLEGYDAMYEAPPRWFDRCLCALGWILLLLAGHCAAKELTEYTNHRILEEAPVTAPSYPREP